MTPPTKKYSWLRRFCRFIAKNKLVMIGLIIILFFIFIGVFADWISPYDPLARQRDEAGKLLRLMPPSWTHPFGTTIYGRDILSQTIHGTRVALIVGSLTALLVAVVGMNIGLLAGYYGGKVDNILMRFTDIVFSIPTLPFSIVAFAVLTRNIFWIILVMSFLFWTSTARAIRSQVLSLKERPFVDVARSSGASNLRIIYKHIMPNILPIVFVETAYAVAQGITTEASISFLGVGDPNTISWGSILYDASASNVMYSAWWWFLPPGLSIMLVVMAFYFVGRAYEEIANPRLRKK